MNYAENLIDDLPREDGLVVEQKQRLLQQQGIVDVLVHKIVGLVVQPHMMKILTMESLGLCVNAALGVEVVHEEA